MLLCNIMDHNPTTPARALPQPPASARWHPRFDLAGAGLSLACAAHCVALPLLLAFVPAAMMALRSFQHPGHALMTTLLLMSRWEWLFALLASAIALVSTLAGSHRHGQRWPRRLAVAGTTLLLSASLYPPLKESLLWHGLATACGGVLLAAAHLANRSALRSR